METNKYKMMTQQLRLTHSDEDVANYIRWIIKSDTAKDFWVEIIKDVLLHRPEFVVDGEGFVAIDDIVKMNDFIKSQE